MRTATIRDVELVTVGTHAASTGVTTVTRADLDSMLAAHADGLVDHAPIKLGHASPLNDDAQLGDGAPAYGWVIPTRVETNAAGVDTLIGDLVAMPAQLAEVAPTAYRRRSVEIAWQVKAGTSTYAAVLIGVALLGAAAPAVKGLADLVALYTQTPEAIGSTSTVELVDGLEANPVAVAMLTAARAAGATVAAVDAIATAAGAADTASIPPPQADAADHETTQTPAAPGTPRERTTMDDAQLRTALSLEADADVDAALAALLADRATDPAVTGTDPVTPVAPVTPATPVAVVPDLVDSGAVATLSAGTLAELQRDAAWARETRRAGILDDAVRSGRIAPAERSAFAERLNADEAGITTLLGALSPRFATSEFGHDGAPNAEAGEKALDDFDRAVFGLDRS